jgi:hypothetical protein
MDESRAMTIRGRPSVGSLRATVVFGLSVLVVVACSSPPSSRPNPLSGSRPISTVSASAATHVPSSRDYYLAARKAWLDEGHVWSSADQGLPLERAIRDLEHAEATGAGESSGYPKVIAALKSLEHTPDAMDTRAEDARARADVKEVDAFFHLNGNVACKYWPSTRKVCWEPSS